MTAFDKKELTEVQFKNKEASLKKFGNCWRKITMASSRMEADG